MHEVRFDALAVFYYFILGALLDNLQINYINKFFTMKKFKGNKICTVLEQAYCNRDMLYIGDPETARVLTEKFKIEKFFERKKDTIATVGWSPKKGKKGHWYGWSHRALASFKTRKEAEKFAKSVA